MSHRTLAPGSLKPADEYALSHVEAAKQYVLDYVRRELSRPPAVEARAVIDNRPGELTGDEVRYAIWDLSAQGELEFTPDWRVRVPLHRKGEP